VPLNGLVILDGGERAGDSPVRRSVVAESTLAFVLREAVKLARGRKDPVLLWLLHKCVERTKGAGHE
jgi:hypothetical protein